MADHSDISNQLVGLPPGELVYVGYNTEVPVSITCFDFESDTLQTYTSEQLPDLVERIKSGAKLWLHVTGLHNTDLIKNIGEAAGLSAMILEDVVNAEHTAKFDFDEQAAIFITKVLLPSDNEDKYDFDEDHFVTVVRDNLIISYQESEHTVIAPVYRRVMVSNSRIRTRNVDYLAYALIDTVADSHLEQVRMVRDDIEALEEEFMDNPDTDIQKQIHRMRSGISELRKAI